MNSNQIHIFEDYAVAAGGKPNGNQFIPDAIRVKVTRVFGRFEAYNKRETGYISALRLDNEGEPLHYDNGQIHEYRTRDVISDWDEYEDQLQMYQVRLDKEAQERAAREAERRAREEQRRKEQNERYEREQREREQQRFDRENAKRNLLDRLSERGFNTEHITIDVRFNQATITLDELQRWLDSLEKVTCETCDRTFMVVKLPENLERIN